MSITIEPSACVVERLVEPADGGVSVVGPFSLGVGVMHEAHEARTIAGRGPLQHLVVAVGIAEGEDRSAADELVDATGLPALSSMKSIFGFAHKDRRAVAQLEIA